MVAVTETVTGVQVPEIMTEPATQVSHVGGLVAPLPQEDKAKVALMVRLEVMLENVYEELPAMVAPSIISEAT